MRQYEIVFVIYQNKKENVSKTINHYKSLIKSLNGFIDKIEDLGCRKLAYIIKGVTQAYYICIKIKCHKDIISKIDNEIKFDNLVIRHLITKI